MTLQDRINVFEMLFEELQDTNSRIDIENRTTEEAMEVFEELCKDCKDIHDLIFKLEG